MNINCPPIAPQEPLGFEAAAEEAEEASVSPVDVAFARTKHGKRVKKTKTKKGKGKLKSPKEKSPSRSGASQVPQEPAKAEVINSFLEVYRGVIKTLPVCMWPTSTKHGQHSYTV